MEPSSGQPEGRSISLSDFQVYVKALLNFCFLSLNFNFCFEEKKVLVAQLIDLEYQGHRVVHIVNTVTPKCCFYIESEKNTNTISISDVTTRRLIAG